MGPDVRRGGQTFQSNYYKLFKELWESMFEEVEGQKL